MFLTPVRSPKLNHQEAGSEFMDRLVTLRFHRRSFSPLTLVVIESVIATKVRTGALDCTSQERFRHRLRADISQAKTAAWRRPYERHHQLSRRLLVRFGASMGRRTLDALQLAVALKLRVSGLASFLIAADHRLGRVAATLGCPPLTLAI